MSSNVAGEYRLTKIGPNEQSKATGSFNKNGLIENRFIDTK